jgi:RIO-like serine/threonine protein kinase
VSHGALGIVGFTAILTAVASRLSVKIYYDILSAIHLIQKAGERPTLSNIGHRAQVPNTRLQERLRELAKLGLIDARMQVTGRGFEYCMDYKKEIEPFLRRYGLSGNG